MKAAVVYESMFGNTKEIGEAIAEGLRELADVRVGSVDDLAPERLGDVALVIVGGPTQSRGIAKRDARRSIESKKAFARWGPVLPGASSLAEWLERLPTGSTSWAAFDTRLPKSTLLVGSAAREIARRLAKAGHEVVGTESFFVEGTGGPLVDGERVRAVAWGQALATSIGAR